MKLRTVAVSLLSLSLLAACGGGQSPPSGTETDFGRLQVLSPNKQDTIRTRLKVNVVFVGYRQPPPGQVQTPQEVNVRDFQDTLPQSYQAINRAPSAYGNTEYTGNAFDYDYNYVFADQKFEDDFFAFLTSKGTEKPLTVYQKYFNCQFVVVKDPQTGKDVEQPDDTCTTPSPLITRPVTGNYEIDAQDTENWLADNGSRVGVKSGEYTVYLINWYSRPDFKFHSYTRANAADSDTGTKFGARASRRMIAWGGSVRQGQAPQRVWFYDLSANPDYWTDAWDVTHADSTGDGTADYRMPPIWEYGTRKASTAYGRKVSVDLALVTRYTALNLLFTPSPLYRAALTPPQMPEDIRLDMHVEQGAGAADPAKLLNAPLVQDRVSVLRPFAKFSNTVKQTPLNGDLADVYRCFFTVFEDACSPEYADYSGERLFQYTVKELRDSYKTAPAGQYLLPIYAFNDNTDSQGGLLGIAYDDGQTGTQSFVYGFLTPSLINPYGYGFTDTLVHETGHHLSLSHPHDGYDSEQDLSYGPSGRFRFVDVGDESGTVMSYNDLSRTFGQFNLDSQYRYLSAAYLNNTNAILELTRRAGKAAPVTAAAQGADALFVQAQSQYNAMSYLEAARLSHQGYRQVLDAAIAAGVDVQAYKWYENLTGLSTQAVRRQARISHDLLPKPGAWIFPEETPKQRALRLAP